MTIVKAELTRDVYVGELMPFVRITLGEIRTQTQVCEDEGQYPVWEKLLEPPIPVYNM